MLINSVGGGGGSSGRPCVIAVHEGGVQMGGTFVVPDVPFEVVGILLFSSSGASTHGMYRNKETGEAVNYYGSGSTSDSVVDFSQSGDEVAVKYQGNFYVRSDKKIYLCLFGEGGPT